MSSVISIFILLLTLYVHNLKAQSKVAFDLSAKDPEWVLFATTQNKEYEYNKSTICHIDPKQNIIHIQIKEIPKKINYKVVKSQKMMEHRSLQDYQDRLHLSWDYEGYENYTFTINDEEIDGLLKKYAIIETTDFDISGKVLFNQKTVIDNSSWITSIGAVPETAAMDIVLKDRKKAYTGESNQR